MRERNNLFDNYKAVLIFFVVLGHTMERYGIFGLTQDVRVLIYSFHMPAFVFISGYFSKNLAKSYYGSIENCLLPFLFFNTVWQMAAGGTWRVDPLLAVYVFWYLLSLFFWRVFTPVLSKVRCLLPAAIVLALFAGCFHMADRYLSISRTIVFFPFFLLGYYTKERHVKFIRNIPKALAALGLFASVGVTLFLNRSGMVPYDTYENKQCYFCSGLDDFHGMAVRFTEMLIAFVVLTCLFCFVPEKKKFFTICGRRSITVYIGSTFLIELLFAGTRLLHFNEALQADAGGVVVLACAASAVMLFLCSREFLYRAYTSFFRKISDWLLIR